MMTDKRRAAIRRTLNAHLDRLEAANRLCCLRGSDGKPIEAYEVRRRRILHKSDMFLETARKWLYRQPGVWGMKAGKDGVIFYGPHFE